MTKIKLIREHLENAVAGNATAAVRSFLTELARHDDMSLQAFFSDRPASVSETDAGRMAPALVDRLRSVFDDDDRFRATLASAASDRSVTREDLNAIYETLIGMKRKLPTKATKARLAQDIADLRLERVRASRASAFFGRPPAE